MKTPLLALAMVTCLAFLVGCQGGNQAASSTDSQLPSEQVETLFPQLTSAELTDFEQLYTRYLRAPEGAIILATTWTDASEIEPDCFIDFFSYEQFYQNISWEGKQGYPAEELEKFVQEHFDVSVEHMRTAKRYDATKNIYTSEGIGGGATAKVISAKQEKDILVLDFEVWGADGVTVIWGGSLSIQLYENGYKYIACKQYDM